MSFLDIINNVLLNLASFQICRDRHQVLNVLENFLLLHVSKFDVLLFKLVFLSLHITFPNTLLIALQSLIDVVHNSRSVNHVPCVPLAINSIIIVERGWDFRIVTLYDLWFLLNDLVIYRHLIQSLIFILSFSL